MILNLMKTHGQKWCEIAKGLTNRTENMVKNRYYTYLKFPQKIGKPIRRREKKEYQETSKKIIEEEK